MDLLKMRLTPSHFLMVTMLALAGCNSGDTLELVNVANKVEQPLPKKIQDKMRAMGMATTSAIMMRIFKEEGTLEVWKANAQNRYQMIAEYKICAWSGRLGPKKKEGDRQAPEGFYTIYPSQMNPQSNYYLSFNIGYPNKYDRAHGSSGTNLMVHGACSSAGCYSMTDAQVLQIYAFARDAFRGGQQGFQVQALPFKMTAENMAKHRFSEHYEFWKMVKVGYDHFELTHRPPVVDVCEKKYVFNQVTAESERLSPAGACPASSTPPALTMAYSSYSKTFERAFEIAARRFDQDDYVEPSEAERKAMTKQPRRGGNALIRPKPQTTYVLVDPKAKPAPQSDAVIRFAAEEAGVNPAVAARSTQAAALPAAQTTAGQTTGATVAGTQAPVPAANPAKPVVSADAVDGAPKKKPLWKIW